MYWSPFLRKLQGGMPETLLLRDFNTFPVNIAKFL